MLVIGSRGSQLALWQANWIGARLAELGQDTHIEIIRTTGDKITDVPLAKVGTKGLFTKEIEEALLDGCIDLAVHSLKDLQTAQPEGLIVGAVCEREVPNDVLISKSGRSLNDLPQGAKVATGSLRRGSQLLHYRPDIEISDIRGNVPTRLQKFNESELDGLILAYAGLIRLGFESRISEVIPFSIMLPAVGQGSVAIETRKDDRPTLDIVERLDHEPTRVCVTAERAFLRTLEGGCQVPIGAHASLEGDEFALEGLVGSLDGSTIFREKILGEVQEADELGVRLASNLIEKGAGRLLEEIRVQTTVAA